MRHSGGGAPRRYRMIDFKREHTNVPGKLMTIEYDPNRNVRIGLIIYANGAKTYILMPARVKVGATIITGEELKQK